MDANDEMTDWAARVEQQTAPTTELSERLQRARATAESPAGEVAVTVDNSGGLADLRLSEQATRLPSAELGELILATSRRAQARLAQQVADLTTSMYGAGSATASFINGAYAEQFPAPDDDDEKGDPR